MDKKSKNKEKAYEEERKENKKFRKNAQRLVIISIFIAAAIGLIRYPETLRFILPNSKMLIPAIIPIIAIILFMFYLYLMALTVRYNEKGEDPEQFELYCAIYNWAIYFTPTILIYSFILAIQSYFNLPINAGFIIVSSLIILIPVAYFSKRIMDCYRNIFCKWLGNKLKSTENKDKNIIKNRKLLALAIAGGLFVYIATEIGFRLQPFFGRLVSFIIVSVILLLIILRLLGKI